jgi:hypothetical protein
MFLRGFHSLGHAALGPNRREEPRDRDEGVASAGPRYASAARRANRISWSHR